MAKAFINGSECIIYGFREISGIKLVDVYFIDTKWTGLYPQSMVEVEDRNDNNI